MHRSSAWILALALTVSPALAGDGESKEADSGDDALAAEADRIQQEVAEIRGLPFKGPVQRRWKERAAVRDEFVAEATDGEEATPGAAPGAVTGTTRTLVFLGLVDGERSAARETGEFMAQSVAGYYDPDSGEFTIVRGSGGVLTRMVVFHELVHALEDQHFPLMAGEVEHRREHRQDHVSAWRAVIEGSATLHTDRYLDAHPGMRGEIVNGMLGLGTDGEDEDEDEGAQEAGSTEDRVVRKGAEEAGKLNAAPAFLVIGKTMFPYYNGAEFLRHVLPRLAPVEGKDAVGRIYADPPVSTEQILHPEKYLGRRDLPATVHLPDVAQALGEGWSRVDENTMGELGAGIAINRWLYLKPTMFQVLAVIKPPEGGVFQNREDWMTTPIIFRGDTGKAVAGWDGDRYAAWVRGEDTCLLWVSTWDSEVDAREFADVYARVLGKKYPAATPPGKGGTRWTGTGGGVTDLVVVGDRVLLSEAVPAAAADGVLELLAASPVEHDPDDAVPAR